MKRILPIVLLIAMAICLTSCDPETAKNLGSFMGKMGQNVFGLEANMKDVNNATQKVDNAVTIIGDSVTIDLEKAAKVMDDIGKIKASSGKIAEFQAQLSEPVSAEKGDKVQEALQGELDAVIGALPSSSDPQAQEILDKVAAALADARDGISDNPTKADLVAVAVISDIADLAKDIAAGADANPSYIEDNAVKIMDKGLSALNTLKLVSDVAGINLLDGLDIGALFGGESRSRDIGDDVKEYIPVIAKNVRKLVGIMTTDGAFDPVKYKAIIGQAMAVRSSFELMAVPFIDKDNSSLSKLDPIFTNPKIKKDLSMDDFVLYFECLIMTEAQKVSGWQTELSSFITNNYAALMDLENKSDELADLSEEMKTKAETAIDNATNLSTSWNSIGTLAVLMVKTGGKDIVLSLTGAGSFSEFVEGL